MTTEHSSLDTGSKLFRGNKNPKGLSEDKKEEV